MKYVILSLIFLVNSISASPIKAIVDEDPLEIDIPAGSFLKVLTLGTTSGFQPIPIFIEESETEYEVDWNAEKTVYGPIKLIVKPIDSIDQSADILIIYEIRETASSLSPFGTAVVPNDETGDFDVMLEQSNDLEVWNSALPGEYASSSAPTFFRVRIAKK